MAESQTKTEAPKESKETPKEPTYPRDRLIAEAEVLLGEPRRHIVAGALASLKGTGEVNLADTRKAIESYRKREVKEATR